jgi:hypothetical protein
VVLDGSVSVDGISASVHGSLDATGLQLSGDMQIGKFADAQVSGRLYFASQTSQSGSASLTGVTDTDQNGNQVQVQAGDFVLRTAGDVTVPLIGFDVTAGFSMGHLGTDEWVLGSGSIDALGASLAVEGTIYSDSSGFHYDLTGKGDVVLDGYTVASAKVTLGDSEITVNGSLDLGPVASAGFDGWLKWSNGMTYSLSGSGSVDVLGTSVTASVALTNQAGPVQATVTGDGRLNSWVSFDTKASFSTSGDLCIGGTATLSDITGTATFCSPGEPDPGVTVSFSAYGFSLSGSVGTNGFDLSTSVDPGNINDPFTYAGTGFVVTASWYFNFEVSSYNGLQFDAEGSGSIEGCIDGGCDSISVQVTGGGAVDSSGNDYTQACVDGTVVVEVEVCGDIPGGVSVIKPDLSVGGVISGAVEAVGSLF